MRPTSSSGTPKVFVTASDTVVELPWRAALDKPGMTHWSRPAVPHGSHVSLDIAQQLCRIIYPGGRVRSYAGLAEVSFDPDPPGWDVTWEAPESPTRSLGFLAGDGGYELSVERIEGHETELFLEFLRMVSDPGLCPRPCDLPDGIYTSNMGVEFEVCFGRDGSPPSLDPVEETVPTQPDFPYHTMIEVTRPFALATTEGIVEIKPGIYTGKVRSFNRETGEVIQIRFKGHQLPFRIGSRRVFELMGDGTIELLKVLEERMPVY